MAIILPRLGKIKMGEKEGNRPVSRPYFVAPKINDIDSIYAQNILNQFIQKYGDKPTVLDIMFPSDNINIIRPITYKRYIKNNDWICKSKIYVDENGKEVHTGVAAFKDPSTKTVSEISCNPETCSYFENGNCNKITDLFFLLPKIQGFGCWHLVTKSFVSTRNLENKINYIKEITGGRIALIPLKLAIIQETIPRKEGTKIINQTVNACDIDLGSTSVENLINYAVKTKKPEATISDDNSDDNIEKNTQETEISTTTNISETTEENLPLLEKARTLITGCQISEKILNNILIKGFGVNSLEDLNDVQLTNLINWIKAKTQKPTAYQS